MKKMLFLFSFMAITYFLKSQNTSEVVPFGDIKESFNKDVAKTSFTGKNPATPSFNLDLSKDFALSGSVKVPLGKNEKFSLLPNFNLGSTNKYTPLFDKGKWAINTSLGLTGNFNFISRHWFFKDQVDSVMNANNLSRPGAMDKMNPDFLSQYSTWWVSADVKYNYKKYLLLKDSLYPSVNDAFDKIKKSDFLLTLQINGLRTFSVRHGIQLKGSVGYTFSLNSNNYEKLDEIKVSKDVFIDSAGTGIRVSSDESSGRKGELKFSNGHIITGDVHFTYNPKNTNVGLDIFATPTYTINSDSKILNLKTGLNFAINSSSDPGKSKSYINIGIAVDFKDLSKGFSGKEDAVKRIIPSLMLGVPLPAIADKN